MRLTLDQINATFELAGACFRLYDCWRLYRAKRFIGGSLITAVFFTSWGLFNTMFYPSLHQEWSFWAAIALTTVNAWWIVMAIHYNHIVPHQINYDPKMIVGTVGWLGTMYVLMRIWLA